MSGSIQIVVRCLSKPGDAIVHAVQVQPRNDSGIEALQLRIVTIAEVRAGKIRAAKHRADKRKRPERAGGERAPPWVRELLGRLVPGWSEDMHPDADETG